MADRIIEIIIETNDKTSGVLSSIQDKLLKFDKSIQKTKNRLKSLVADNYSASLRLIDKVTPEGSKINSFLKSISTKVHFATIGLIDKTAGGIRNLETKLLSLTGKAYNITMGLKDNASKGIKNIADGALMQTAGIGLSMMGTAGIGYGVVNAFQSQMDFEKQMSAVKAIMGDKANVVLSVDADTGKATTAFDALVEKAEEMGATTKFTSGEAAKALYYMGMAGWSADKQMAGLPALMNLAAAANEDLARTSDIMTDSMTGFGVNAGDMIRNASGEYVEASQHFADMLAAVATGANTDVSTMGETFKYSASSIQAMYSSGTVEDRMRGAEDLALITGIMANAGIKGSQAGTSQKALFTRLSALQRNADYARSSLGVDFVDQETGQTRRLRDIIGDFRSRFNEGMKSDEIIDLAERLGGGEKIQKDTKKKLSAFLEHVQENGGQMNDSDKMMMASMLSGQEAMSGWLAAFLASDEDWNRLAESIDNCDGAAEKMAKIQLDNLSGDITMLGSAWDAFQRSFVKGEASEGLRGFIQSITDTISKANELFKDGIQISDFGSIISDTFTKLKNKALAFDGIGSILAGGVLIGALAKITQKARGLIDIFGKLKSMISGFRNPLGNNTTISANTPSTINTGSRGLSAASKVGTMNISANVVNLNSKSINNGVGNSVKGTGKQSNSSNPPLAGGGNGSPSGSPSSARSWKSMAKVGAASAALPLALGAIDMYSTSQYNKQTAAEAQYEVDVAMSNLQSAQRSGDSQAIEQSQQALAESAKYQRETAKYNREREIKSTGSMLGSTVGAVAGGLLGGPMGAMVGGMLGEMAGNFLGGLYAQHTENNETAQAQVDWKTDDGRMFSELSYSEQAMKYQHMSVGEKTRFEAAHQEAETKRQEQEEVIQTAEKEQKHNANLQSLQQGLGGDEALRKATENKALNNMEHMPSAEAVARHKAADKPLTEAQINDINRERGLRASEKAMMEGSKKVEDFFTSVSDFFSGKVKDTESGVTNLGSKTEQPKSIQEANQLGTDFWSSICDFFGKAKENHESVDFSSNTQPQTGEMTDNVIGLPTPQVDLSAFEEMKSNIGTFFDEIPAMAEEKFSSISEGVGNIANSIGESFGQIPTAASTAFNSISNSASETWSSVQTEWSQLPSFFDVLWSGAGSAASAAGSAIASGINSAIGTIQSAWEGLSSWLSSKISSLASMASSAASSIMGAIGGGGGGKAMAEGGFVTAPQHIYAGEAGPEVVIPLSTGRKARARDLLERTLRIVNGVASPTGFGSSESLKTNSASENMSTAFDEGNRGEIIGSYIQRGYESILQGTGLDKNKSLGSIYDNFIQPSLADTASVSNESITMPQSLEYDELGNIKGYQGLSDNLIQEGDLSPVRDAKIAQQMADMRVPEFTGSDLPELPPAQEMPISNDNSTASNEINVELGSIAPTFTIEGGDNPQAVIDAITSNLENISDMVAGQIADKVAAIAGNQVVTA